MSGPKFSCYTISEFKRALLLEEQRFQMETVRQKHILSDMDVLIKAVEEQVRQIEQLVQASELVPTEAEKIRDSFEKAKTKVKSLLEQAPTSSADLKALNSELQKVHVELSDIFSSADLFYSDYCQSVRNELSAAVQNGFKLSFSGIVSRKKRGNIYLRRINELLSGISSEIPQPLLDQFQSIRRQADEIVSVDYLENFCSVVVEPFVKACRIFADYNEAAERYRILANEAGINMQPYACTAEGIQKMKETSDQLEMQILAGREQEYIKSSLDAAMLEMGYHLVGSRVQIKKNGRHIRHGLYSLNNGTAVDVTYADNGQISMELGGISMLDRSPTVGESIQLVDDMQSFCQDYVVLEKKLAERGVRMTHISCMPPSAEYAQIINANDYELYCQVKNFCTEDRTRKTAGVMYQE